MKEFTTSAIVNFYPKDALVIGNADCNGIFISYVPDFHKDVGHVLKPCVSVMCKDMNLLSVLQKKARELLPSLESIPLEE